MIGFRLTAVGTGGFTATSSNSTEGSLVALQMAMKAGRGNTNFGSLQGDALKSIQHSLDALAMMRLDDILNRGLDLTLVVVGDVQFIYIIKSNKNSTQAKLELIPLLKDKNGDPLGKQVLKELGTVILNYASFLLNLPQVKSAQLRIDVDL